MGLNQCNFIGNIGRDPEVRYTQSNKAVCNFNIGVSTGYGDKKTTEWVSVVCWEKTAEAIGKYCSKGSMVFVSGRMVTREWEQEGIKKYKTEIVADTVQFLGGKTESNHASKQADAKPAAKPEDDDDIPW